MLQGVYQRGLSNDVTRGRGLHRRLHVGLMGAALNTPVGGFSGDVTLALPGFQR